MATQSIKSSIVKILDAADRKELNGEYDNLLKLYRKNNVSCYALHVLIKTALERKKYINVDAACNTEFYVYSNPKADCDLQKENEILKAEIEKLKQKAEKTRKSNKHTIIILGIVIFILLFILLFLFYFFLYCIMNYT